MLDFSIADNWNARHSRLFPRRHGSKSKCSSIDDAESDICSGRQRAAFNDSLMGISELVLDLNLLGPKSSCKSIPLSVNGPMPKSSLMNDQGHEFDINCTQRDIGIGKQQELEKRFMNANDAVMRNFPPVIANCMMEGTIIQSAIRSPVSIFFSNIPNYAHLRGSMNPLVLFSLLERLFGCFDDIAVRHGVQRVDTIDGCYIAAANFSSDQPTDHALRLARFAVDAMAAASAIPIDEDRPELGMVHLQAGLHCGEVCGCMMGTHGGRKYTLVGDAVNVASRMESQGQAGAVQCSGAFAAELGAEGCGWGELELAPRDGGVQLRGRGWMSSFWLAGAAAPPPPDLCVGLLNSDSPKGRPGEGPAGSDRGRLRLGPLRPAVSAARAARRASAPALGAAGAAQGAPAR